MNISYEFFIIDLNYVDGCLNDTLNNISITSWPSIFIGGETSCDIQKRVVHTKLDIYFFICMVVGFISINTINAFGEAYSIQLYMIKFSVTYRRSVVFS